MPTFTIPPFFTGRMPFLSLNQQCQSTEGTEHTGRNDNNIIHELDNTTWVGAPQSISKIYEEISQRLESGHPVVLPDALMAVVGTANRKVSFDNQ